MLNIHSGGVVNRVPVYTKRQTWCFMQMLRRNTITLAFTFKLWSLCCIWRTNKCKITCYYYHQIGSIHISHCFHICPRLCVWDVCYTIFCHLLYIHSGKTGNLFSLILCSLRWVQIVGYVLACRSYSFVCTLHHLIIIIVQTLSEDIELIKCLSDIICRVCE